MQNQMLKKENVQYAAVAAVAYTIPASFYIGKVAFSETWMLYLGNFLFAIFIGIFIGLFYKKHVGSINIPKLIMAAGKTTLYGIVIACLLCFLLLVIFRPAAFSTASLHQPQLQQSPAQFAGAHQGYVLILFMNAILGNGALALFLSLLLPFSIVHNQQTGTGKP